MAHARHREPDFTRGDPNTLGGYLRVHDRPAAFEGTDGFSYSAEAVADRLDDAGEARWGAYLLFVQWARVGHAAPRGHLESDYLAHADTEADAVGVVDAMPLADVTGVLHALIAAREGGGAPARRWWDAMRDDVANDAAPRAGDEPGR